MSLHPIPLPYWLNSWIAANEIAICGAADLQGFITPYDNSKKRFPFAISFAIPMNPYIMVGIQNGPNQAYANEYNKVNILINKLSIDLAEVIKKRGYSALPLAASERNDVVNMKGVFPHKTAATRAGLGWIGRNCQLISRKFGPWVRLGTVFTDIELTFGQPIDRNFCGRCMRCIKECPAKALKGNSWYPGIKREEILDVNVCDQWKKKHYSEYNKGHNCGICSAVCPYGLRVLKKV